LTKQDPAAVAAPDLIGRDFTAAAPGQRFVGDISTYLPTEEGPNRVELGPPGVDGLTCIRW
jgi:hypothetical protein